EALAAGAVTVITKPKIGLKQFLNDAAHELTSAIRTASRANVKRLANRNETSAAGAASAPAIKAKNTADVILAPAGERALTRTTEHVVAIGCSTGGTQALQQVLTVLPSVCPAVVIVQHMPPTFTAAFAQRLDGLCRITVKEAQNNDRVV